MTSICAARILAVGLLAFLACGCATILDPGPDQLLIQSDPPGAEIVVSGFNGDEVLGHTPATLLMPRERPPVFRLRKPGFAEARVLVPYSFNPVTLLNILFLPGFIVDFVGPHHRRIGVPVVHIDLQPMGGVMDEELPAPQPGTVPGPAALNREANGAAATD